MSINNYTLKWSNNMQEEVWNLKSNKPRETCKQVSEEANERASINISMLHPCVKVCRESRDFKYKAEKMQKIRIMKTNLVLWEAISDINNNIWWGDHEFSAGKKSIYLFQGLIYNILKTIY